MNHRIGVLCILLLALLVFGFSAWTSVHDPFFSGDAGARMHGARLPVVRIGNRIWLPMLQAHISVLYRLHLPYYAFKVIPSFYLSVAAFFLGLVTWRLSGYSRAGFAFALALMFCFAHQRLVQWLGLNLYQEILELAFFFLLLWAVLHWTGGGIRIRAAAWVLPFAAAALLIRESFWIYLFTTTLLFWRQILARKKYRYAFLCLWAVPVLWLSSIPFSYLLLDGRFPAFPVEWPLGINKAGNNAVSSFAASWHSLYGSLSRSGAFYLVAGAALAWAAGRAPRGKPHDALLRNFGMFSLLSLGMVYGLILVFHPWEATSGSPRMAAPLLAQGFLWAGLLFAWTSFYPAGRKLLARGALVAAMVLSMDLNVRSWVPQDNSQAERDHAGIEHLAKATAGDRKPNVCFLGIEYFTALHRFITPTLYASRRFPRRQGQATPAACDLVITPQNATLVPGNDFAKYKDYTLAGLTYTVYHAINRRAGT